jgi:hypothetical protein
MAARPDNGKSISILSSRRNKSFLLPPFAIILQPMESNTPRKTKIIATLGPATESVEMVARLMDAGVNVFRLNMSHASHDWVRRLARTSAPPLPRAGFTSAS